MSDLAWPVLISAAYLVFVWFLWRERAVQLPLDDSRGRVLFLCTHNSARSQIAEALLRHHAGHRFFVASAGTAPTMLSQRVERWVAKRAEK